MVAALTSQRVPVRAFGSSPRILATSERAEPRRFGVVKTRYRASGIMLPNCRMLAPEIQKQHWFQIGHGFQIGFRTTD